MNLITIFLTGLLTGGLTCLAVQGGLLASAIAQEEQEKFEKKFKNTDRVLPIILFLLAKIITYTILGALLGLFGSVFQLSIATKVLLQLLVGIFMLGTALNFLNVHPIFRYFIIQPPRFLTRLIRKQTKNNDVFTPAVLGAFTVFIPCGVTQSMMALAITSANPFQGALIMFVFILGTTPLFFTLGYLATKLEDFLHKKFLKVAGFLIIFLAIININSAIAFSGSKLTIENIWKEFYCTALSTCSKTDNTQAVNEATITIEANKYSPNIITVRKGSEITLNIVNKNGYGCIQAFTIPQLGIQKYIPPGSSAIIKFTAPDKPQEIAFMCSMGMYRGKIIVK